MKNFLQPVLVKGVANALQRVERAPGRRRLLLLSYLAVFFVGAFLMSIQSADASEDSIHNLMVVLRESEGSNKPDAGLIPTGAARAILADGKEVELSFAWFEFIGDMHLRFVYDSPDSMRNLTLREFEALKLTPQEAVRLAVKNVHRVYGKPTFEPWSDGVMIVEGESPDLNSSYFLDEPFWKRLLVRYPEGLVVAVPERGGLLFAPVSDRKAVERLRKSIGDLFTRSDKLRVSSAIYLYKGGRWSVMQAPVKSQ